MQTYHVKMVLRIDAILEGEDHEQITKRIANGVGDILLAMGSGSHGREGSCEIQGELLPIDGPPEQQN